MDQQFTSLNPGEVISVAHDNQIVIGHNTFRVSEFATALKEQMLESKIGGLSEEKIAWLTEAGIACEVLKFGATSWQKGKVRIHLEFCPDEVEEDKKKILISDYEVITSPEIPESQVAESEILETPLLTEEDKNFETQKLAAELTRETETNDSELSLETESAFDSELEDINSELSSELEESQLDLGEFSENIDEELELDSENDTDITSVFATEDDDFDLDELSDSDDDFNLDALGTSEQDENNFDDVWQDMTTNIY